MIYKFSVKDDKDRDKVFYLTAESLPKLYRRILSTYGITKDGVTLLAEYEETKNYSYKLKKSYEGENASKNFSKKVKSKANEIYSKNKRLTGDRKVDYIARMRFTEVPISKIDDLYPLVEKYKKVKVYFEKGEKRGVKRYYALVRD